MASLQSGDCTRAPGWRGSRKRRHAPPEAGQPAGQNTIEPDLKGCALFETWSSVDGGRGRSINFYDRAERRWHQTSMDDRGGALELDGALAGGSKILEGERPNATAGTPVRDRIAWTPLRDGSVRQHWQMSKAKQSTWETVFDGLCKPNRSSVLRPLVNPTQTIAEGSNRSGQ